MAKRAPSAIRVEGDVAYVELTRGFEAIVDASDVPLVEGHRWRAMTLPKGHIYALRTDDGPIKAVLMHRVLLDAPSGVPVDHRDGDGLNNRRGNIRLATHELNNANRIYGRRSALGLKGVQYRRGKFTAAIKTKGKSHFLGNFETAEEAAAAYYGAARVLWGDFASP